MSRCAEFHIPQYDFPIMTFPSILSTYSFVCFCLLFLNLVGRDNEQYHLEGFLESPKVEDDGECFSPILLNATSLNIEVYYNKAVNYTLMVTFVSFIINQ